MNTFGFTSKARRFFSGFAMFLVTAWLASSCSSNENDPSPQGNTPVVTDKGTPRGSLTSASIGPDGGTLLSADGNLKITVPPGALSSSTVVSIQPISNEGPLGVGVGYRLQPEGITFSKPVSLEFHYQEQMLEGIPEDFLWVITQAADGSWNAMLKSEIDTDAKVVSVETTHFSDWALGKFLDLTLEPSSRTLMKGKSVELRVAGFVRDNSLSDDDELAPLVPITTETEDLAPLTYIPPVESRLMGFRVKGWTLNGTSAPVSNSNGKLQPNKNTATYTAPNQKPSSNPVAVTVQLEASNKEGAKMSFSLTSNISIVDSNLYLLVNVDGQTYEYYQYGFNGTIPPDPNDISIANAAVDQDDNVVLVVGTHVKNNIDMLDGFAFQVRNPSEGTHVLSCFAQSSIDDMNFALSTNEYTLTYTKRTQTRPDYCEYELTCGDVSVTFISDPMESEGHVRGYFSGTLYEDKDEFNNSCTPAIPHHVEGEFWLVRSI